MPEHRRDGLARSICIVHPIDPEGARLGGVGTTIKDILSHLPPQYSLSMIGTTADASERPLGEISRLELNGRELEFLPVAVDPDENRRTRFPPMAIRFLFGMYRYRRKIKEMECGLYQFHRLEAALPFLRSPLPKITFLHWNLPDMQKSGYEGGWKKLGAAYKYFEKYILSRMKRIIVTDVTGRDLYRSYPGLSEKVELVPPWVNMDYFAPYPPASKSSKRLEMGGRFSIPSGNWVIFSGRLEKQKDPRLMISSFAHAFRALGDPGLQLVVVGDGSLRKELEAFAQQQGLDGHIHFLGNLKREDIRDLLNSSSILLLSSAFETGPMAAFEALSCGIPVVSTSVGMLPYVIENGVNGFLADGHDEQSLGNALREALSSIHGFSAIACRESVKGMSRETAQGSLVKIYEEIFRA